MKFLIFAFFIYFTISVQADDNKIDWTQVLPPMEVPGFWDGRSPELKKLYYSASPKGRSGRIVGGWEATPHAFPYQAAMLPLLQNGFTSSCGASLIGVRTVLTAAHCLENLQTVQIILGAHNRFTVEPSQQRQTVPAANVISHELYDRRNLNEDIAVIHLEQPATLNEFVQPVALPTDFANDLFVDEQATAKGWGRVSDVTQQGSSVLMMVTMSVMTNSACSQRFRDITDGKLCTSGSAGRGTCVGDSGGALTVSRFGQLIQIGISSFVATAGCEIGFPSGFTRVTAYLDWIARNSLN